MLLKDLRTEVLEANLELVKRGLVLYTFGNASGVWIGSRDWWSSSRPAWITTISGQNTWW